MILCLRVVVGFHCMDYIGDFSNVRYAQRMCLVVNIFTRENENRLCNHVSVPRPAHGVGLDGVLSFFE